MTTCPQCGYQRTSNDDKFISSEECPKCGIFYKKWKPSPDSENPESTIKNDDKLNVSKEKRPIPYKSILIFAIIFILLAIFAKFTFFTRNESPPEPIVFTLPVTPPLGMESNSYIIRASGSEKVTTAAGQIFTPLHHAPVLLKLGFLFTQYSLEERVRGFKLQIILSEWNGDHPSPTALWISGPTTIPFSDKDFQADWLDFDIPHLSLNPAQQYIAWVTLSGMDNQPNASVGIPGMGPRYSRPPSDSDRKNGSAGSPYPQGMRALYKQENSDGDVSKMTNFPWEVHDVGHNLHFRMSFVGQSDTSKSKKELEIDDSQREINETTQQQQENAIIQLREMEQQRVEREQQLEQQRVEREKHQYEMEQQRERQRVEREIQQYENERLRDEMKLKQQQQDEMNRLGRVHKRVPKRSRMR